MVVNLWLRFPLYISRKLGITRLNTITIKSLCVFSLQPHIFHWGPWVLSWVGIISWNEISVSGKFQFNSTLLSPSCVRWVGGEGRALRIFPNILIYLSMILRQYLLHVGLNDYGYHNASKSCIFHFLQLLEFSNVFPIKFNGCHGAKLVCSYL